MTTRLKPVPGTLDFERGAILFLIVFVDVLGLTLILPLLHLYAVRFQATPLQIGIVAAAFPASQLIGVPLMGALSDRFGRKPLLLISQVSTCIGFLLLAFANSLEMLILSRVVDGIFGANLAVAQSALSDVTDDEHRAQALGLTGAAFGLGFIFGPVISLLMLEVTNDLNLPAFAAAGYSLLSIYLTARYFKETLVRDPDRPASRRVSILGLGRYLADGRFRVLLVLLFAQQLVFYGFESLLGTFTLTRLGLGGQGNAFVFVCVGAVLVVVQVRYLGKWRKRYGEARLVLFALLTIGIGLIGLAATPSQAHPLYVERIARADLNARGVSSAEAVLGSEFTITLPPQQGRGFGGLSWLLIALVPLSVGSALIRPCLNALITRQASDRQFGSVLGVSTSAISAADAIAPLVSGYLYQRVGTSAPYLIGGLIMFALCGLSVFLLRFAMGERVVYKDTED